MAEMESTMSISNYIEPGDAPVTSDQRIFVTKAAEAGGKRFYPHDFVVQKDKYYPYEWSPTFGSVIEPAHPILDIEEFKDKPKIDLSTWKYEDGLTDNFYVHWGSSSLLKHVQAADVGLVDRLLVKGQKVGKSVDGEGIFGTVVDTQVQATLQILGTNHVIADVDTRKLKPLSPFARGIEILYDDTWVGIITDVRRQNTFRVESFGRGKKITIETHETDGFMKQDLYWSQGSNYPGQKTRLSSRLMKNAVWEGRGMNFLWSLGFPPITYLFSSPECTSLSVAPLGILVQWLQLKPTLSDSKSASFTLPLEDTPPNYISSSEFSKVIFLGVPSYQTLQMNSVRTYKLDPKDGSKLSSFNAWISGFRAQFMNQEENYYANHFYPPDSVFAALSTQVKSEVPVKVLLKQTSVTVEWENGTSEKMLASKVPVICSPKESRIFRSGTIVSSTFDQSSNKYGVIQLSEELVMAGSNTILVKWIEPTHEECSWRNEEVLDLGVKEESIYDIRPHEEYTFFKINTLVFLKKERLGAKGGVVLDIDIRAGTMRISAQSSTDFVTAYPHQVIPLTQRSYWNFFTRKWSIDSMLPHEHQFVIERKIPVQTQESVSLSSNTNLLSCLSEVPRLAILESAPSTHCFYPYDLKMVKTNFNKMVMAELELLKGEDAKGNVPDGIWIRGYENRMDLLSVLYLGPVDTPYEDGLFLFDLQLSENFPNEPPRIKYISYSEPLNPLIATDGTFCVSKLQWNWEEGETKPLSYIGNTLLQIQSLMFSTEPFFASDINKLNQDTARGAHSARIYNEKVYINVLTSAINKIKFPHDPWREIIGGHYSAALVSKLILAHKWVTEMDAVEAEAEAQSESGLSETESDPGEGPPAPLYPLLPLSKGFKLALCARLDTLDKMLPAAAAGSANAELQNPFGLQDSGFQEFKSEILSIPSDSALSESAMSGTSEYGVAEITEVEGLAISD